MKTIVAASVVAVLLAACAAPEATGPKATAVIRPASGTQVHGEVTFTQISATDNRIVSVGASGAASAGGGGSGGEVQRRRGSGGERDEHS